MNTSRTLLAFVGIVSVAVPHALGLGFLDEALLPPTGMVGKPYSHRLNGRAGSPPYHFKIDSGKLPPGVTLSTNGLISGVPTASGNYKIWANLGDSRDKHSERQISITIFEAQPPKIADRLEKPGWKLIWHDEFEGVKLDRGRWTEASGVAAPANAVIRDGVLHLRIDKDAPKPAAGRQDRVSGIETRRASQPFAQQYGWFEMRARAVKGSGLMAVFSLRPLDGQYETLKSDGGTRTAPGEAIKIDVLEQLGRETNAIHHTTHFGRSLADGHQTEHRRIGLPFSPQEDFHVYALEWDAKGLIWYLDGIEVDRSDKRPHTPLFLDINVYEEESKWRGEVDGAAPYPKDFEIDYVRVYQKVPRELP